MRRKFTGLNLTPKLRNVNDIGRGAFLSGRSSTGRSCGLIRRENAGMSSEMEVGLLQAEYLRFPG